MLSAEQKHTAGWLYENKGLNHWESGGELETVTVCPVEKKGNIFASCVCVQ